jgi:hypothetical protein
MTMPNKPAEVHYFPGLDLGQAQEVTALAVLMRTKKPDPQKPGRLVRHYAVRHLERFPPGTPYTDIGARLAQLFAAPPLSHGTLAVDQTMVGRPVMEMLGRSGIAARLRGYTVTAGHTATMDDRGDWLLPKKVLASTLQVLFQARRLKVARTLTEADKLMEELANFKLKAPPAGNDLVAEWREGPHDDLVLAVAIAAYEGEHLREAWLG